MHDLHELAQILKSKGRGGDTVLAHITPQEAMLLDRVTDGGSINPITGLPEFWSDADEGFEGESMSSHESDYGGSDDSNMGGPSPSELNGSPLGGSAGDFDGVSFDPGNYFADPSGRDDTRGQPGPNQAAELDAIGAEREGWAAWGGRQLANALAGFVGYHSRPTVDLNVGKAKSPEVGYIGSTSPMNALSSWTGIPFAGAIGRVLDEKAGFVHDLDNPNNLQDLAEEKTEVQTAQNTPNEYEDQYTGEGILQTHTPQTFGAPVATPEETAALVDALINQPGYTRANQGIIYI